MLLVYQFFSFFIGQAKGVEYAKKMARGYLKSNGMGNYATVSPKSKTSSSVKDKTIIWFILLII